VADGNGLFALVSTTGLRAWRWKYRSPAASRRKGGTACGPRKFLRAKIWSVERHTRYAEDVMGRHQWFSLVFNTD